MPPKKVKTLLGEVPRVRTPELLNVAALVTVSDVPPRDKL